jgi:acyl dehydratase
MLREMDIPLARLLHGEQSFRYHKPVCAGDRITVRSSVSEIYDKKGGALEFVTRSSRVTNQDNELVAELRSVLVVRH